MPWQATEYSSKLQTILDRPYGAVPGNLATAGRHIAAVLTRLVETTTRASREERSHEGRFENPSSPHINAQTCVAHGRTFARQVWRAWHPGEHRSSHVPMTDVV